MSLMRVALPGSVAVVHGGTTLSPSVRRAWRHPPHIKCVAHVDQGWAWRVCQVQKVLRMSSLLMLGKGERDLVSSTESNPHKAMCSKAGVLVGQPLLALLTSPMVVFQSMQVQ
eukprot:scaffold18484_cov18-Tisochrysis_lutea.AAC.1